MKPLASAVSPIVLLLATISLAGMQLSCTETYVGDSGCPTDTAEPACDGRPERDRDDREDRLDRDPLDAPASRDRATPFYEQDFMEFRSLAELNADPQLATSGQTPNHVTYSFHTDGRGTPWGGTNYLRGTITKYAPGVDDFFLGLIVNPLQEGQPQVRQRWVEWYYRFNGFEIESQWKYFFNNEDAGEGDVNRWNWYQNPGKLQGYGASDRDGREPGWWFPRGSSAGTPANKAWFDANVFNGRWIRHRVFAKMSTDSGTGDSVSSLWIDDLQLSDEFIGAHDSPAGNWFGRLIFGANGDVTRDSIPCSVDIGYLAVYHQDPGW